MSPWLALWSFLSLPIHVYCFNDISFRLWLAVRRCRSPVSRVAGAVWPIVSVSDYVVGHLISHKLYCVGLSGTVRLAWPRWANLSPVYRHNELSALTAKVPVEWKCNFQNEWTNQKFYSKNKILLSLKTASSREIHLSSLFPIGFTGRKNKFGLLNGHMMKGFSCPALPSCGDLFRHSGHHQNDYNCRLLVISDHTRSIFGTLWYKGVMKTTPIAICGSSRMQFCVSCDLFTDFAGRVGHGTNPLAALSCGSRSNAKLYLQ